MHQHTRRVFIILFMTGIISTTYWLGPIESTSSDQKSQSAQSKTQAKSPPPVGAKSLPENQVPGRTSRRRSSVGGTVSSGVAGKPSTQAADTSNVPTPAIPVGQSGEMIGVPWTGAAGIIETTEQMMIRERQAQLLPRKPRPLRKELEYERPKDLPQNPDAPAVSQWPPVDESNSSQRPGQPGFTVQPLAPQTTSTSFTGATLADTGAFPPDTMGAVGPTQYCVAVNGRFRTFNKTTGVADGNLDINSDVFFASVLTTPSAGGFIFTTDPQIRFDRLSDRWFIVMLDVPLDSGGNTDKVNRILLAVSNTATITSSTAWTLYQFQGDATLFTDYESLGIDASALYIGGDMFALDTAGGAFNSTKGFVVRKAEMLTASPLVVTAFPNLAAGVGTGPFAPRGADNYDPANTGPSATGYFVGVDNATFSTIMFRRVTNPAGTPTISANISVTVPTTSSSNNAPQQGSSIRLDTLDDRLYAAHIRNGRLWTAHNIRVNASGVANTGASARHAVRWYEFQNLGTTPTVVQSGTQFDNTVTNPRHHFIPSIMVSGQGHAAMGCSTSGSTQFAGAFTNGRLVTDMPLGTLQAGVVYQAGAATYDPLDGGTAGAPPTGTPHRWGDYSYTCLDPCDDMTMWTIQEFANATNSYGVRVVKLLAPVPTVTACGTATNVVQGTTNMNIVVTGTGFYNPPATGMSACRVPISASVSGTGVTVNSTTFTSETSVTINITVAGGATTGARDIVITNPDGQSSTGSNGCINITAAPTATVTSINRLVSSPQCAGTNTTLWQATFSGPVSGVTASNFQLVNPGGGLSGFALGTVAAVGSPPTATWNISANVGTGSGTLELDMVNSTGVTPTVTNVPFTSGQTYSIVATPTTATVGGPQTICANGTTTGLGGNTPSSGTGTWSIDSGGTGTFNPNATTPNATFTHTSGAGPVIVRWTISNPPCTDSSATVTITVNPVATVNAGPDQTICAGSGATLAGSFGGGASSVTWSGGAGTFTPNATTPTATYTPSAGEVSAGTVTLTLTTDDPTGPCTAASDTMTITINPAATVNAGPDQTVCASSPTVTLAGSFGGSATSATWSGGAGTFTPNVSTLTAVYTPSAGEVSAGTVTLTLTTNDPTGPCPAVSDTVTITINPVATVNAGPDQMICAGSGATLAGSFGGGASGAIWSGGAGTFTPNIMTPTATYTPSAGEVSAGTVTLTLTTDDPTGPCTAASDTITITINPAATVNAGPDQTVCASSPTVTLAGSFGGSATSATWSGGAGSFTPNNTTLTATYTPTAGEISAGTVTLTLTTNDPTGPCPAVNDSMTITITALATVNAGPDQTICAGSGATLAGSFGGGASSATWSGGAGTFTPNATTPTATYTPSAGEVSAGTVTLTLTTDDPTGPCTAASDTMTITINPAATVNAGPDQTVCASSPTVTLAGSFGGSATSATWSGGAGSFTPNNTTLTATYTPTAGEISAGTVTLTLTTNDPTGPCPAVSDTVTITINPVATVNAGPDQMICAGSGATLAGSFGGSAASATWSGGAGTFTPNATTLTAVYTPSAGEVSAGTVTLTLTTNDPTGPCGSVTDTVIITIIAGPTANAGPDQTVCASSPAVLLAGSIGGSASNGTWSGGAGSFTPNNTALNAMYTPTAGEIAAGTVILTLTTNNPGGVCGAGSDSMTITIVPLATVNAGPDQTVCSGSGVTLAGSFGGGASSATWSGGGGTFVPNASSPTATYTPSAGEVTAGTVTLTLTTNDPVGPCTAVSDTVTITINQAATVNAGPDQTICAGLNVILAGSRGGSATTATWSGGSGTFAPNTTTLNATYTPSPAEVTAGFVTLTLTTDDPAGLCPAVSDTVTINLINCTLQYALMVADTSNNRIQGFDGTNWAVIGLGTVGSGNGQFRLPEAVAFSFDGQRIYVADTGNNRIQWSTDAGVTWADFATNGTATNQVKAPQGLAVDSAGNLYVSDTGNGRVMRFNNGVPGFGVIIASNGTASGQVGSPRGLAVDSTFRLFVTDETNSRILRINNANTVVAATSGTVIATAGTGMNKVQNPQGITIDSSGTIFVADTGNSRILRWVNANPANASTMALTGSQLGQVNRPEGVTVVQFTSGPFSGGPFLVVGDTSNNRIQGRFIPTGQWSLVGSPNNIGSGVGQFRAPSKIQ